MMVRLLLMGLFLPTLALAQYSEVGSADNPMTMNEKSVNHVSIEGEFRVTFPSGCGKTVTRIPAEDAPDEGGVAAVRVVFTFCDRYQEKGEGCSVASYFNVTGVDGGYPGPDQVVSRVKKMLESMNLEISNQSPLSKNLPDGTIIEGLDLYAADANGVGQAWLRGLLYEGDIYIMSAWKDTGGLWNNPEYITFFNSFQPGTD